MIRSLFAVALLTAVLRPLALAAEPQTPASMLEPAKALLDALARGACYLYPTVVGVLLCRWDQYQAERAAKDRR